MKKIFIILTFLLLGKISYSQNAFSDALLIEKNRDEYLKKINLILNPELFKDITSKPYSKRQQYYLENVKKFLEDPWDQTVDLNLKIFMEIPNIVSNYQDILNEVKQKYEEIVQRITDYENRIKNFNSRLSNIIPDSSAHLDSTDILSQIRELILKKADAEKKR